METQMRDVRELTSDASKQTIQDAACLIRGGSLVIFPTETVYGLGADATNAEACKRIYEAKGRPSDNPLIIHIAVPNDAEKYTYTSPLYDKIAEAFMPGPITVIMPAKEIVPLTVRSGLETVAVRCPSHPVSRALISACGVPIAAPSANLSGKPSPTCFAHVKEDMDGRVDMILDGGPCEVGLESTIVKIESDNTLTLLRPGKITPEDLYRVCQTIHIAPSVLDKLAEGETVLSPGMKYRHYAPNAPVYLLKGDAIMRQNFLSARKEYFGLLCYNEEADGYRGIMAIEDVYRIGASSDMETQAHLLFYALREADKKGYDAIYAPLPEASGMGLALYNRMIRASAYQIIDLTEEL